MSICYGNSLVGTSGINGDAFYISSDHTTFLLADGASGAGEEGKVLMSRLCVEMVKKNPFLPSALSPKLYIDKIIWSINNELIRISQKQKRYIFGTLVLCVVWEHTATIASVGDSPAFLIQENSVVRVAQAKKRYQNLIDLGLYSRKQLEEAVHELPEHMWSMFDSYLPMVVPDYEITELEMKQGDCIVLCSDGISDYVEPQTIKDSIKKENLPQSIRQIINLARERSVQERKSIRYDDLTMIVYCD